MSWDFDQEEAKQMQIELRASEEREETLRAELAIMKLERDTAIERADDAQNLANSYLSAISNKEKETTWTLNLNKYQRDNLLWLINLLGYPAPTAPVGDFGMANTGDWVGEIACMLAPSGIDSEAQPNVSRKEIVKMIVKKRAKARGE